MARDLLGKRFTKKVSFEFRAKGWRGDGWGKWRREGWIEVSIKRWNWFTKWKWKLIPEMRRGILKRAICDLVTICMIDTRLRFFEINFITVCPVLLMCAGMLRSQSQLSIARMMTHIWIWMRSMTCILMYLLVSWHNFHSISSVSSERLSCCLSHTTCFCRLYCHLL